MAGSGAPGLREGVRRVGETRRCGTIRERGPVLRGDGLFPELPPIFHRETQTVRLPIGYRVGTTAILNGLHHEYFFKKRAA